MYLVRIWCANTNTLTFDQIKQKWQVLRKTSLKAFSHQRRAKPFNTLRSKAESFEKSHFKPKNHLWPKSHFKFDKIIFGRKAVPAEKPLLPNSCIWPKSLTDLIQKIKNNGNIFWFVRNPIWSSLINFDHLWTDPIQKNPKWNNHC